MRVLPWLVGGGVLAYAITRQRAAKHTGSSKAVLGPLPGRWVWPVPRWNGRAPVISDGFDSPRVGYPRHGGVDIMFARQPSDALKAGTPNGSKLFVMPDGLSALAASDGTVRSASSTPHGYAVVIDHVSGRLATFYTHLEKLTVRPGDRVHAGQPIGTIGDSPLDAAHLKHLHFEVWFGGPKDAIDPAPLMHVWQTVADPNSVVARNAALVYRPVGDSGEAYPDWVRALDGRAGVYIIRDRESREIVYVGSSSGHLYATLTRHFQTVRHEAQEVPMT